MALSQNQQLRAAFQKLAQVDTELMRALPDARVSFGDLLATTSEALRPQERAIIHARLLICESMLHLRTALRLAEGEAVQALP